MNDRIESLKATIVFPVLSISDYSKENPNVHSWTVNSGVVNAVITLKVEEKVNDWKRIGGFEWSYIAHDAFVLGAKNKSLKVWGDNRENYEIGGRYWDKKDLWIIIKVSATYFKEGMTRVETKTIKCYGFGQGVMSMRELEVDGNGFPMKEEVVSLGAKKVLDLVAEIGEFVKTSIAQSEVMHIEINKRCARIERKVDNHAYTKESIPVVKKGLFSRFKKYICCCSRRVKTVSAVTLSNII